jgi:putative ABC transport system ATP-binding protein
MTDSTMAVVLAGVRHSYCRGKKALEVLRGISLRVPVGECVFLVGPSGSGKSSLLSIIGCLLTPTVGHVSVLGQDAAVRDPTACAKFRLERIGFLFQRFHLIRGLNAVENVMVPLLLKGQSAQSARIRAEQLLFELGLSDEAQIDPRRLSVGQCQRVALARALAIDPDLLLVDEPTASLDWSHGRHVIQLLHGLARARGKTVIGVTHDQRVLPYCDRILHLEDGVIREHRTDDKASAELLQETCSR